MNANFTDLIKYATNAYDPNYEHNILPREELTFPINTKEDKVNFTYWIAYEYEAVYSIWDEEGNIIKEKWDTLENKIRKITILYSKLIVLAKNARKRVIKKVLDKTCLYNDLQNHIIKFLL